MIKQHSSDTVSSSTSQDSCTVDFFTKFNIHGGWKSLLLYQFELQFSFLIMLSVVISYSAVVLDAAFALGVYRVRWIEKSYDRFSIHLLYGFDLIYFIDLVSMTIYKHVDWIDIKYRHKPRNSFLIFIEFLTLIPLDGIYFTLTKPNMRVLYLLRLRYALRAFRLIGFYYSGKNYVGARSHISQLCIIIFYVILFVITASAIAYVYSCCTMRIRCIFNNSPYFTHLFYTCVSSVVLLGQATDTAFNQDVLAGFLFYLSLVAYVCNTHLISQFICDVTQLTYEKYSRVLHYEHLKLTINRMVKSHSCSTYNMGKYIQVILTIYNLFWTRKKGIKKEHIVCAYLPEVKYKELNLDMAWYALKHSHIFRSQSTSYLRHISKDIIQVCFSPGEFIYKKNERKTKMVYIVSGVVQILSEDDNETPMISFSEGTCLGETAMLIDYPSTSSVICKVFCEATILERKHYIRSSKLYPLQSRHALRAIVKRYDRARKYKRLATLQKKQMAYESDELNLQWLKYILRKLLGIKTIKHDKGFLNILENITPCYKYLDVLVIAKELELVTDSIFLKTTFPYIFQPDSIVLKSWRYFVFVTFIYFSIIFPYNLSTAKSVSKEYLITHFLISLVWYVDLYIEASTAVRTREHFHTTVQDIVMYRFTTSTFILNFLSALSPGVLLLMMVPTLEIRELLLFETNKMLKIYIIEIFFNNLTFSSIFRLLCLNYCKYLIYLFYLLYYVSVLYYVMACFDGKCNFQYQMYLNAHNFSTSTGYLVFGVYSSIKTLCNFERTNFVRYFNYGIFSTLAVMYLFNVIALANLTAYHAVTNHSIQGVNEYMRRFQVAVRAFGLNNLYTRIVNNITKMYQFNGLAFIYSKEMYQYLPKDLFQIVRNATFSEYLKTFPFFSIYDKKALKDIASKITTSMYEKNELIVLQGEHCSHMHIIIQGYCISYLEDEPKVLGPGSNLSMLEVCMQLRALRTIYTITHCLLMSLSVDDFNQILLTYPNFRNIVTEAINSTREDRNFLQPEQWPKTLLTTFKLKSEKPRHVNVFRNILEKQYYGGYPSWLKPLHLFVIPVTLTQYGNVIKFWEILRAIFAMLNVILVPMSMMIDKADSWNSIFVFLDVMAWIDICLRFHVAYFDSRGLEVTHPFKTATHYLLNGFLLDLISAFPTEVFIKTGVEADTWTRYYRYNRMLQIRRLFGLLNYFSVYNVNHFKVVDIIKNICAAAIIINIFASCIFNKFCNFFYSKDNASIMIRCRNDSWLHYFMDQRNITDRITGAEVYLYSVFFVTALFGNVHFPFVITKPKDEKIVLMVVSTVGYIFWMYVTTSVIAKNLTMNFDLITYQNAMHALVKFMHYRRIDRRLKTEVITHFEYIWKKTRIAKIHDIMALFPTPFKKSILFDVFGIRAMKSKIFSIAGEPVVREMLLYAKHNLYLKTGIIYSVNDVHGHVYLLYKGKVEVLGADQTHLTFLTEGSIFGNLDNFPKTRQTLTMVASGHVELLVIDTVDFHTVLAKHPEIHKIFMRQISLNVDYIDYCADAWKAVREIRKTKKSRKIMATRISEDTMTFIWWKKTIVAAAAISAFLEIYHMVTLEHKTFFTILLYFFDILFVIKIILKFHAAYVDEFGILNRNKHMISERYRRMGFYYDLSSILPIEIICIFFTNHRIRFQVWCYMRANRLIRITRTLSFLRNLKHKLNVNAFWLRTLFLFFNCILFLVILCSFMYFVDSYPRTKEKELTSTEKLRIYYHYWKVLMNMIIKMNVGYDLRYFEIFPATAMIFIILMSRAIGLYFITGVITTSQVVNRSKHLFKIFTIKIETFMQQENISYPLMKLNNRYVSSLWLHYDGIQSPSLLDQAPYYLKEGILNSMFGLHLRKHPIFKKCHVDLIRQISANLKTYRFFPGDMITYYQDIDHCMYFIESGQIHALSEDSMYNEVVSKILTSGDMFGFDQGIYLRVGHQFTYKVVKKSFILILKREDWIYLLDYFPASKLLLYDKTKEKQF